jgi:hypothetical protein
MRVRFHVPNNLLTCLNRLGYYFNLEKLRISYKGVVGLLTVVRYKSNELQASYLMSSYRNPALSGLQSMKPLILSKFIKVY